MAARTETVVPAVMIWPRDRLDHRRKRLSKTGPEVPAFIRRWHLEPTKSLDHRVRVVKGLSARAPS